MTVPIEPKIYQVSEFLDLINSTLEDNIGESLIIGEVSDLRYSGNKWVSFALKDEAGLINCFSHVSKARIPLEDGMMLKVLGKLRVYAKYGKLSFSILAIEAIGEGSLKRAYELLLKKLAREGLFDEQFKLPLPRFPRAIGLITSADSAALGDVRKVLSQRWGDFKLLLIPVKVQGIDAAKDIIKALRYFNEHRLVDVIILTRGGGSLEDLQSFNDEQVARTIFASRIPIIAAIGHERDVTIVELAADQRASTPSNAAQLTVPDRKEIALELEAMNQTLANLVNQKFNSMVNLINHAKKALKLPLIDARNRLDNLNQMLIALDPKSILRRGYSVTMLASNHKIIKKPHGLKSGERLITRLAQGKIYSEVTNVSNKF